MTRSFQAGAAAVEATRDRLTPLVESQLDTAFAAAAQGAASHLAAAAWHLPDADEVYDSKALEQALAEALKRAKDELDASMIRHLPGAPPGDYDPLDLARLVAQRHRGDVAAALLDGWNDGITSEEMAARLEAIGQSSAALVARTSMTGMANAAGLAGAVFADVRSKTWLTAEDDRVRDSHAEQDQLTVALVEVFPNGCRFPGDPMAPGEETWNCRCTLTYGDASAPLRAATVGGTMTTLMEELTAAAEERNQAPGVLAEWTSPGIAFLNTKTGDGRALAGDIGWNTLPLPLMAQLDDAHGSLPVMQSHMAGGINSVSIDGNAIPASGVIDDTEMGAQTVAALATSRYGVSIDLAVSEAELVLNDGGEGLFAASIAEEAGLTEPESTVIPLSVEDELFVVTKGSIMGATVVPFAAFADARIVLTAAGAPTLDRYVITAAGEDGFPQMIRLLQNPQRLFVTYRKRPVVGEAYIRADTGRTVESWGGETVATLQRDGSLRFHGRNDSNAS